MKGITEKGERGKLGRREGQRLKESLLLEEDMGGGLLLHWDQTVGAGASIGPAHHRLYQRETAMRSSDDDNYDDSVSKMKAAEEALEAKQKIIWCLANDLNHDHYHHNLQKQSSFELSGKLAAETNRVIGITLLFTKPPYAKKPDIRWRLYVFKGGEALNGKFWGFFFI
ncbi:hypothetical protein POTOM_040019 [Populus tomentosa]|uniref:Uncharacterized protein n=1 Tax=Populus tomentosa TaxID=118781 RepID=A0A8X7YWC6_POPTO|nr:hypothetical protein POTOM_040019 [Populus tomentosa]